VALSESLSFSATAKQLFISQSVLSKHIMSMENELGTKLFIRDGRSVRPTESGRLFTKRSAQILDCYDMARQEIRDLEQHYESVLKVGYLSISSKYLPQACEAFHKSHPAVRVSVAAREVEDIISAVREGSLDIGCTISSNSFIAGLETSIFFRDSYGMLCRRSHPLAQKKSITIEDLKGLRILTPDPSDMPAESHIVRKVFADCGYEPDLCEELHGIGSIRPFLLTGGDVAFTVGHVLRYVDKNYVFLPIEDIAIKAYWVACWKSSHENEILRNFTECLHSEFIRDEEKYVAQESRMLDTLARK
jgi:DNA-binding transcriptional LysR family regulator